jgi:hypothetical protein
MLTHHLTFVQLKSFFISQNGGLVEVGGGLHPDDVNKAGFTPIIAVTISVEGLGYHFQRNYTLDSIPISKFLLEAWNDEQSTFGIPDRLVIDSHIHNALNFEDLLGKLCQRPPELIISSNQKYSGSKKAAQNVYNSYSLKPSFESKGIDPIPTLEYFVECDRLQKGKSTPERRVHLDALISREVSKPTPQTSVTFIAVEDWMRDSAKRTPLLDRSERLILQRYSDRGQYFRKGHKALELQEELMWRGDRRIYLTQSEGLMRCLWSINLWPACFHQDFGIDDIRQVLWEKETVDREQFEAIKYYLMSDVRVFYPDLPLVVDAILSFIDARVLRKAELKVLHSKGFGKRYFVYEIETNGFVRIVIFKIDTVSFPPGDNTLSGLPVVELEITNSDDFGQMIDESYRNQEMSENVFVTLQQELDNSSVWEGLSSSEEYPVYNFERDVRNGERIDFSDPLEAIDRQLIVAAFQALHRERLAAYKSVCTACELTGNLPPKPALFGIEVVNQVLRTLGAKPEH